MEQDTLIKGNIYRALIRFTIPFMLANLLQVLYGAADLLVVGKFATTPDSAAVSIGSQIMMMITQVILGLTTGTTILLGQYFGAGKKRQLSYTVGTSVYLFAIISIILTVLLVIGKNMIVSLMKTPIEAISATGDYLFICSLGIILIVGYNVVSSILRGLGDSRTPLIFVFIACIINIVLDVIFVKYYHLGAKGAALATVIAQGGSLLFSLIYLYKKGLGFPFYKKDLHYNQHYGLKILKIGAPIAIQNTLIGLSFLLITVIINQMGLVASAAVGVVEKLIEFLMLPAIAFGAAVSTMSAQNFGAGLPERARKCMYAGISISLIFAVIVCIYCQFAGQTLTYLFNKDPEVVKAAAEYLKTYSIDCIAVSFVFCMNGYFNGCGHSIFSMIHSLISTFAVRIPLSLYLSQLPNVSLTLMGWAAPISTFASLVVCIFYLQKIYQEQKQKGVLLQ